MEKVLNQRLIMLLHRIDDGTISGNTASGGNDAAAGLRNIATGGQGHAVYRLDTWRNATAGPTMNTATYGFWLND